MRFFHSCTEGSDELAHMQFRKGLHQQYRHKVETHPVSNIAGIYVFHTWSFCAGRKTSTIGLIELCIIIICWIFCAYTQILSRDVEDFCVHAQKFLIMILNNKVFQHWIICAYRLRKSLIETWKIFVYMRRNF